MPWKDGNPPLYSVWRSMIARCYDPNFRQRKDYGGRGIKVCPQWRYSYYQFYRDMNPRPKGYILDRIDNDGDYSPKNCQWVTRKQSQLNRRITRKVLIEGKEYVAAVLAEKAGLKTDTIIERAEQGLTYKQVMSKKRRFNLDGLKKGVAVSVRVRKSYTHCKNGHLYTPKTTRIAKEGWRECLLCLWQRGRYKF